MTPAIASEPEAAQQVRNLVHLLDATGWSTRTEREYRAAQTFTGHPELLMLPAHVSFCVTADRGLEHIIAFWAAWDAMNTTPSHFHFNAARHFTPQGGEAVYTSLPDLREHIRSTGPQSPLEVVRGMSDNALVSALAANTSPGWTEHLMSEIKRRMVSSVWVVLTEREAPWEQDSVQVFDHEPDSVADSQRAYHGPVNAELAEWGEQV